MRSSVRVGQQSVGQRLYAELLAIWPWCGALLKGQVMSSSFLFAVAVAYGLRSCIGQLALLVNRLEHRGAPIVQLAQVGQALVQLRSCTSSSPVASLCGSAR